MLVECEDWPSLGRGSHPGIQSGLKIIDAKTRKPTIGTQLWVFNLLR
ncbi:hypothetical protein [Kaarinaea lacus]